MNMAASINTRSELECTQFVGRFRGHSNVALWHWDGTRELVVVDVHAIQLAKAPKLSWDGTQELVDMEVHVSQLAKAPKLSWD